jgi:hypothetical protein
LVEQKANNLVHLSALPLLKLANGKSMKDLQLHYINVHYQVKGYKKQQVMDVLKPFVKHEFIAPAKSKAKKVKVTDAEDAEFKLSVKNETN